MNILTTQVRAIKNRLKRQGNKGRKKRRGRPSKNTHKQRQRRHGMSKKEQAAFIWEHQYLIVRKHEEMSKHDKKNLTLMLKIAPDLTMFRTFNQQFYLLFEQGISKQCARLRRTRLVSHAPYQANSFLAKALKKLSKDKFDHMIVFLGWDHSQRTNNHVERNNRVFRMMQKTRYKRRKTHTITKALELDLYCSDAQASLISEPSQGFTQPTPRDRHPENGCVTGMGNENCPIIMEQIVDQIAGIGSIHSSEPVLNSS